MWIRSLGLGRSRPGTKRSLGRALAVVVSGVLFSSCSWLTDFAVVNGTDHPITITYRFKDPSACGSALAPEIAPVTIDRQTSFGPLSSLDVKVSQRWSPLPHRATGTCESVIAEIPPHSAARIARLNNYSRPTLDDWKRFDLARLEVSSSNGRLRLCGPAVLVAFEGTRHQQVLVVNGAPAQMRLNFCGTK